MRTIQSLCTAPPYGNRLARAALIAAFILTSVQATLAQSPDILISQVYGGGGGSTGTPTFNQDYIEIFNRSASVVDLSTWSVQYAEATGTTWVKTDLAGTILPGQYILVGGAIGTVGDPLPVAADVNGTMDLHAVTGKVALVKNQDVLPAQACFDQGFSGVVDIVGYGTGPNGTNCYEIAPGPALSEGLALYRANAGCIDTNNNAADFVADVPQPLNSASTPSEICTPTGACCTNNVCNIVTQANCAGTYLGDYSVCGTPIFGSGGVSSSLLIDISATGTPGAAQGHNVLSEIIDLPFPFFFYDVYRTQFRYSTNGWLTFDLTQTDSAPGNHTSFPNPASPNLVIAGFWDELVSDTSGPNQILFQTIGDAPNRKFIIQYNNVLKFNTTDRYTFQIILHEGPDQFGMGRIEFRYGQYPTPILGDAAIGFEDVAGQSGRNRPVTSVSTTIAYYYTPTDLGRCQTGACCTGATCRLTNQASCQVFAGTFNFNVTCSVSPCSSGACRLNDGTCEVRTEFSCASIQGTFRGEGTNCQSPCPPLGACCSGVGSGACNIRSQQFCEDAGGAWAGPGTTCMPGLCTGACCQIDGTCVNTSLTSCQAAGGTFNGTGSTCETLNPPCPPAGACCVPDGTGCTTITEAVCTAQGGIWDGPGSDCMLNSCRGACCFPQGTCLTDFNRGGCVANGGTFHGVQTTCADVDPPCPAAELCCLPSGQCATITPGSCLAQGGTPGGPGTRCDQAVYSAEAITPDFVDISQTGTHLLHWGFDDVDVPIEIGFPFYFDTGCLPKTTARVSSNGYITFTGPATAYNNGDIPHWEAPNDAVYPLWDDLNTHLGGVWAQTIGVAPNRVCIVEWKDVVLHGESILDPMTFQCKLFEGTNCIEFHYLHLASERSATTGVENAAGNVGTQIPDASLGNGPSAFRLCLPNNGACCLSDGTCESLIEVVCASRGGEYRGDGTDCSTVTCDPFGSCCAGDSSGNCSLTTFAGCEAVNGFSWGGPGSSCSPNPCAGACCIPGGECQMTGAIPCQQQGGLYFGNGSNCDTLDPPCSQMGACCSESGCELRFDFNCGTYFRGPGTTCSGPDACGQMFALLSGQDIGCPSESFTITVTIHGGNTSPYTVTLDNGGGTLTGPSPLLFTVTPTATTTYAIASAVDSLNQPIDSSGSVEILIPTSPDCNANGVWDRCEMPSIEEFVAALVETGDPANRCLADMNLDGQIDGRDVAAYVVLILN